MATDVYTMQFTALLIRGVILIVCSLAGLMSTYLGWRLYRDGMVSEVGGEASIGDKWRVQLKSAGPGIFFALFGMGLLAYCVSSKVTISGGGQATQEAGLQFHLPSFGIVSEAQAQTPPRRPKPDRCLVAKWSIVMSSGGELTSAQVKSDLDVARRQLIARLDTELGQDERLELQRAIATIQVLGDSVGNWKIK